MAEETMTNKHTPEAYSPVPFLALESIRVDERLRARLGGNDLKHVKELVEHSDPEGWLPIRVARINGENWLVGGFHRVAAAKEFGLTHLPAYVKPAPDFDRALLVAFEDNKHHGKPPTLEDRKEHARLLAKIRGDLSYREIGRRAGIDDKTAKAAIEGKPEVEVAENPHSGGGDSPATPISERDPIGDPVEEMVELAYQAIEDDTGVDKLAQFFSKKTGPRQRAEYVSRQIEEYDEEDIPELARALHAMGRGLVEGSEPYL